MIVVGMDLSTTVTGVCAIRFGNEPELLLWKRIDVKGGLPQRLARTQTLVSGFLYEVMAMAHNEGVFIVAEGLVPGIGSKSSFALGKVHGVIEVAVLNDYGQDVNTVNVGTWKRIVTGKGSASKGEVREEVNRRFGVEFNEHEEDVTDAIGVGIAFHELLIHQA